MTQNIVTWLLKILYTVVVDLWENLEEQETLISPPNPPHWPARSDLWKSPTVITEVTKLLFTFYRVNVHLQGSYSFGLLKFHDFP